MLTVVLLTVGCFYSKGQVIIVNVPLGSCAKCNIALSALQPYLGKYPIFLSLPATSRPDSAEVEELFNFKKRGYAVLYSDTLTRLMTPYPGGLFLFNENLQMVASQPKFLLDDVEVKPILNAFDSLTFAKPSSISNARFAYPYSYHFSDVFGSLKIFKNGKLIKTIKVDSSIKRNLMDLLHTNGLDTTTSPNVRQMLALQPSIGSAYKCFTTLPDGGALLVAKVYLEIKGDESSLRPSYVLAEYGAKGSPKLTFIEALKGSSFESGLVLTPAGELIVPSIKPTLDTPIHFLQAYTLPQFENGTVRYARDLEETLPYPYLKRFANHLRALSAYDYPYLQLPSGLARYNLEDHTMVRNDSPIGTTNFRTTAPFRFEEVDTTKPLFVVDIKKSHNDRGIFTVYKTNRTKPVLDLSDANSGRSIVYLTLSSAISSLDPEGPIFFDKNINTLWVTNPAGRYFGVPIIIFHELAN